jgi:hypothetical protein
MIAGERILAVPYTRHIELSLLWGIGFPHRSKVAVIGV